jgi:hypothetical protein
VAARCRLAASAIGPARAALAYVHQSGGRGGIAPPRSARSARRAGHSGSLRMASTPRQARTCARHTQAALARGEAAMPACAG